ncbi:hypothetical protein RFI_28552, partial [Reticulomyxa filosa]
MSGDDNVNEEINASNSLDWDEEAWEKRLEQTSLASQRMGVLLLQGWTMLAEHCPNCQVLCNLFPTTVTAITIGGKKIKTPSSSSNINSNNSKTTTTLTSTTPNKTTNKPQIASVGSNDKWKGDEKEREKIGKQENPRLTSRPSLREQLKPKSPLSVPTPSPFRDQSKPKSPVSTVPSFGPKKAKDISDSKQASKDPPSQKKNEEQRLTASHESSYGHYPPPPQPQSQPQPQPQPTAYNTGGNVYTNKKKKKK